MADKREDAIDALIKSLQSRYPDKGFLFNPAVKFSHDNANGIIAVANVKIQKDEILLVIPEAVKLSSTHVFGSDTLQEELHIEIVQKCSQKLESCGYFAAEDTAGDFAMAVAVMHLLSKASEASKEKGNLSQHDDPFVLQTATWPSEEDIKESSWYYWDASKVQSIWNKSALALSFEDHRELVQSVFHGEIYPLLKIDQRASHFIDSRLPSNTHLQQNSESESESEKEALWNTFIYAYSLVWSRSHGQEFHRETPHIIPLVDLINGNSIRVNQSGKEGKMVDKTIINVALANGKWPFINGKMFMDECNLPCSAIYANRDIEPGEELIISYGDLSPVEFVIKYGALPQTLLSHHNIMPDISLWCDPKFIPDDPKRVACLRKGDYPLEEFTTGKTCISSLIPGRGDCVNMYKKGVEPDDLVALRQFLVLSMLADEDELERNLSTGRLRGHLYEANAIPLMCNIIDYNLELLAPKTNETSADDVERALHINTPAWEKAALLARVAYREGLIMWRHAIATNAYSHEETLVDAHPCLGDRGCNVCGRTYPCLQCNRCKKVEYCSRGHQIVDWKSHKSDCTKSN